MSDKKKIFLVAGGTGGHVFPCVATAQVLVEQGHDVTWVSDERGLKYQSHWPNNQIIKTPVLSSNNKAKFMLSLKFSFIKSFIKILKEKPDIIVGFGGYPSLPMMLAAQALGKKTIVHEANATLGKANALLGKRAHHVAVSFPSGHIKAVLTGNPIRPDIAALADKEHKFQNNKVNILIYGGSLGAQVFNQIVPQAFEKLTFKERARFSIQQQVVNDNARTALEKEYQDMGLEALLLPFIEDMPNALDNADLLMARSGASTVAEVTCAGRPAIFIPYPFHEDRQQYTNAKFVEKAGGGIIIDENDGEHTAAQKLYEFLKDLPDLEKMGKASKSLGKPKAAWTFAELIIKTA